MKKADKTANQYKIICQISEQFLNPHKKIS